MNLVNLCKTADRHIENHKATENRQELALLIETRNAIKARAGGTPEAENT